MKKNRFAQIAEKLPELELDGFLLTSQANRFYATGFDSTDGIAVVTKTKNFFFIDSRFIEAARASIGDAEVEMVDRSKNYNAAIRQAVAASGIRRLGFEEDHLSVSAYRAYVAAIKTEFIPAQSILTGLRAAKDESEIAAITKAQRIAEGAFEEILDVIRPGLTEKAVAAELAYRMLRRGAEKMSFDPIVVSGPNSSLPHGVPTDRVLRTGEFLTMDFGCIAEGYCSDMTRTVALGSADEEMRRVYDIVLRAQLAGIAAARAGQTGKSIDTAARNVIDGAGYGEYFGHSFGHSVGIEIHEIPNASPGDETSMPEGAVVTAEPGIYLPGKFGVRIEDMMVLRPYGCDVITKAQKDLIIL
ncbi:M24 family metallopeptidase [Papillibacter cinnamivorans]|uniref:Xaa-Pro aminopeptidase n=1 Tax=Papillibacter cinnamivorans DSM 12816 TaxID=1122930 RepID=A0A1W1ZDJ3_9FIRM|nr:aminopeptidase P family protein [Papillibacter cinnamivorans]SMC46510.1 Xaa-Pro aminopeptidase [Papillibacter cinnamivorans DSM 12816]